MLGLCCAICSTSGVDCAAGAIGVDCAACAMGLDCAAGAMGLHGAAGAMGLDCAACSTFASSWGTSGIWPVPILGLQINIIRTCYMLPENIGQFIY